MTAKLLNGTKLALVIINGFLMSTVATPVFAESKFFVKEYTYQAGEYDSKVTCRTLALEQAKRLLLEELGTYLESETEIKNYHLSKDQISTYTAGILSSEVIEEKWDGKTYWLKAKISTDPVLVVKAINELRRDKQKTKELEEIREQYVSLIKENNRLQSDLKVENAKNLEQKKKEYVENIKKISEMGKWAHYSSSQTDCTSYYDTETIEKLPNRFTKVWIKSECPNGWKLKSLVVLDCKNRLYRETDFIFKTGVATDSNPTVWSSFELNSSDTVLFDSLCNRE